MERTGGDAGGVAGAGEDGEDGLFECVCSDEARIGRGDDGDDFIADERAAACCCCCCCDEWKDRGRDGCWMYETPSIGMESASWRLIEAIGPGEGAFGDGEVRVDDSIWARLVGVTGNLAVTKR